MNAERLLQHYEQIADATDAIARLRRFILDLAVRGKLVPQDPADEPILECLGALTEVPRRAKGLLKSLDPTDCGSPLPPSWAWLPLGSIIGDMDAGWSPQCEDHPRFDDKEWGVLKTTAVQSLSFDPSQNKKLPVKLEPRPKFQALMGDVLVTRAGPKNRVGVSCVVDVQTQRLMISDKLIRFHPLGRLSSRFIALSLNAGHTLSRIEDAKSGMAVMQMNISQDKLRMVPIPLPPLAEQHRIVAKVDELMALCDWLEAARTERETKRDRLAAASLARLNTPDPETVHAAARFALDALPALTARPDQIKQLRQTILNLAVRGKLVPQDPADEPATELLKRISTLTPGANVPRFPTPAFELPTNWSWASFGQLIDHSDAGWSPKTEDYPRKGNEWGVLKVSAVSWDAFRPQENKQILPGTVVRQQAVIKKGDFLISRANTAQLIARAVIVDMEPTNLMMSDKIVRLSLNDACLAKYAWIVNNYADFARQHYVENASGVSPSMKNVSRSAILGLPFPLPPIAEQHRIVTKVDELMALCNQLETSLTNAGDTRKKLLDALLAEALAPVDIEVLQEAAE